MFGSARWFVRFRWWGLFVAILLVSAGIAIFDMTVPVTALALLALAGLSLNLIVDALESTKKLGANSIGAILLLDVILISAGLAFSGGPANPFTVMLLLPVALAVVLAGERWAWAGVILSTSSFAATFRFHVAVPEWGHHMHSVDFASHLYGMLVAYALTASIVAYFLGRISRERQKAESELEKLKLVNQNYIRLAAMTTYAAGAAHELATPLGTITVAAHEVLQKKISPPLPSAVVKDLCLILEESERCRQILNDLLLHSGSSSGEALSLVRLEELLVGATEYAKSASVPLSITGDLSLLVRAPKRALSDGLRGLVKNSIEAGSRSVAVSCHEVGGTISLTIVDDGSGLPVELEQLIGEPFVSSKADGQGVGLGVYVTKSLVQQLGGSLVIKQRATSGAAVSGAIVEIQLPIAAVSNTTLKEAV